MTQRTFAFVEGEFYHIYNRGTDKRVLFNDEADYSRFIELLYLSNSKLSINIRDIRKTESSIFDFDREQKLVHIGAYCLMPNHFHILITPAVEHGIQTFMQKLSTGYSMYFNKRYERTGTLFQGRFKSQYANSDEYLKYLFSYIHLNPVKLIQPDWKEVGVRDLDNVKLYLNRYAYSSFIDYSTKREESIIIDPYKFPEYFLNKKEIDAELLEWLTYRDLPKPEV